MGIRKRGDKWLATAELGNDELGVRRRAQLPPTARKRQSASRRSSSTTSMRATVSSHHTRPLHDSARATSRTTGRRACRPRRSRRPHSRRALSTVCGGSSLRPTLFRHRPQALAIRVGRLPFALFVGRLRAGARALLQAARFTGTQAATLATTFVAHALGYAERVGAAPSRLRPRRQPERGRWRRSRRLPFSGSHSRRGRLEYALEGVRAGPHDAERPSPPSTVLGETARMRLTSTCFEAESNGREALQRGLHEEHPGNGVNLLAGTRQWAAGRPGRYGARAQR